MEATSRRLEAAIGPACERCGALLPLLSVAHWQSVDGKLTLVGRYCLGC